MGLETQYAQFCLTADLTGKTPIVIEADDLVNNTEATIRAYCRALGIDFLEHSLRWSEELPKEWRHVAGWHGDLTGSAEIKKTSSEKFKIEEIPKLQELYNHHLPYYQKLRRHCITI